MGYQLLEYYFSRNYQYVTLSDDRFDHIYTDHFEQPLSKSYFYSPPTRQSILSLVEQACQFNRGRIDYMKSNDTQW